MVKINRIYTRTGDNGTTGLVGGQRVKKNSRRVNAYGELDELNAFLGWARTLALRGGQKKIEEQLAALENELFDLGAYLASPADSEQGLPLSIGSVHIERLEQWIDEAIDGLPELRSFVLPGGSELNSALHIARCVCRRVERALLTLQETEKVEQDAISYINRLSDYLFAAARRAAKEEKGVEFLWKVDKKLEKPGK